MTSPADRFWAFSLAVYGRPGVADICIDLQDRAGIDVNLLLWAAWAGAEGVALDRAAVEGAIAATRPWRDAVVRPLRGVRRAMRQDLGAMTAAATADLRQQIKAAELEAERLQQAVLAALLPSAGGSATAAAIRDNLRLYLAFFAMNSGSELQHLVAASLASIAPGGLGAAPDRA